MHLLGQQLESRFLEPGRDPTRKRYPSIGPLSTPNQTPTVPFAWFRFPRGFGFHAGAVDQASLRIRSTGMLRMWRRDEDHQFHRTQTIIADYTARNTN
ncbi:hypothetical protein N9B50_00485 [bacterium]|nr:hypothetical protein [bacterium]